MVLLFPGNIIWFGLLVTMALISVVYIVMSNAFRSSGAFRSIGIGLSIIVLISAIATFSYSVIYHGMMIQSWSSRYEKNTQNKGTSVAIDVQYIRDEEGYVILRDLLKKPGMRAAASELLMNEADRNPGAQDHTRNTATNNEMENKNTTDMVSGTGTGEGRLISESNTSKDNEPVINKAKTTGK